MKNQVNNYLKLTIRGKPERGPGEGAISKPALGRIRTHETITVDTTSADFALTARQALDLLFAEVTEAKASGLVASLSAFDPLPFKRFLKPGEVLPRIGHMTIAWGAS